MCFSVEPGSTSPKLRIQVSSTFGLADARHIEAYLASTTPGTDVEVDFREVDECEGAALAHLLDVLRSGRAHVALQGMSGQVWKLLEYLGLQIEWGKISATGHS